MKPSHTKVYSGPGYPIDPKLEDRRKEIKALDPCGLFPFLEQMLQIETITRANQLQERFAISPYERAVLEHDEYTSRFAYHSVGQHLERSLPMMTRPERDNSRWIAYQAMLKGASWSVCASISGRLTQLMLGLTPN